MQMKAKFCYAKNMEREKESTKTAVDFLSLYVRVFFFPYKKDETSP